MKMSIDSNFRKITVNQPVNTEGVVSILPRNDDE